MKFLDPGPFGVRVHTNPLLWDSTWVFPESRWVEYEASDERWCRYFGIGREKGGYAIKVYTRGPAWPPDLFVHPSLYQNIKEAICEHAGDR